MMGMQTAPAQLFYDFCLDDHVPQDHLLRRIDRFLDLEKVRTELKPFYSNIGRPSIDPELMIRMLIVGYCMGIRLANGGTELGYFTCPMVAGSAGLHTGQATAKLAKELQDQLAPQLTGDHNLARTINAVNLEYVLGEINVDDVKNACGRSPPVNRSSTTTLLAHSMPGAGVSTTSIGQVHRYS